MNIVLLRANPRLDWLRSWLAAHYENGLHSSRIIDCPPTKELFLTLASQKIDTLVLVDHEPFCHGMPTEAAPMEAIRIEAQHASFASELARRAEKVIQMSSLRPRDCTASMASTTGIVEPPEIPSPRDAAVMTAWPLMKSYLRPLFQSAKRTSSLSISWPREAFLSGDMPGETLPQLIEVAGRARILAYGPYLPLPAGRWQATSYLGFSVDIEPMPFILEIDSGEAVARGFFEVNRGGLFKLELDFEVVDPLHPLELRLISQDAALEGQAALMEVDMQLQSL